MPEIHKIYNRHAVVICSATQLKGKAKEYGAGYRDIHVVKLSDQGLRTKHVSMVSERSLDVDSVLESHYNVFCGKMVKSEGVNVLNAMNKLAIEASQEV